MLGGLLASNVNKGYPSWNLDKQSHRRKTPRVWHEAPHAIIDPLDHYLKRELIAGVAGTFLVREPTNRTLTFWTPDHHRGW